MKECETTRSVFQLDHEAVRDQSRGDKICRLFWKKKQSIRSNSWHLLWLELHTCPLMSFDVKRWREWNKFLLKKWRTSRKFKARAYLDEWTKNMESIITDAFGSSECTRCSRRLRQWAVWRTICSKCEFLFHTWRPPSSLPYTIVSIFEITNGKEIDCNTAI